MNQAKVIRSAAGAVTGFRHELLLTTLDAPPGHRVIRVIGLVRGNAVRARHVGHDLLAVGVAALH